MGTFPSIYITLLLFEENICDNNNRFAGAPKIRQTQTQIMLIMLIIIIYSINDDIRTTQTANEIHKIDIYKFYMHNI